MMTDRSGYLGVRARSAAAFDLNARLPDQVFKEDAGDVLFCEFDAVLTEEFWPALRAMARWHGDDHVELLVLEPDCDEFYLPKYRAYPAMSLPVEASVDDYWAAIGHDPADETWESIAISADAIAVTGPSGKWGCWGERDPEIAVIRGFPSAAARNEWAEQFGPVFLDVSEVLVESNLSMTFEGWTIPDEYAAALTANYGSPGGKRP